ncbi:AGAP009266-PA-like protein [Anopheles sinensis]|uniref:Low molecular weight phosphotyrosine protein phosphatase n=1 Tax=Anopheles sinensis TaxID=74873 RepID=A0A084WG03_ANOSI|nr:AGAP009266-PA-like protein [Anopheles sinensis]
MKILFVCIGNSCRSPMAESVMKSVAAKHNHPDWYIDSAALREWNVGRSPEERALQVLAENGLSSDHVGRQICSDDFCRFDYIFGMDEWNMADLMELAPVGEQCRAKIELLGNYRGKELDKIIIDPYFVSNCERYYNDCSAFHN